MEKVTRENIDQNYNVIANALQSLDRKVDDEIQFRIRAEDDMRSWVDQKTILLKQGQQFDAESQIEREKRIMAQL
jgi:hypothetical protein